MRCLRYLASVALVFITGLSLAAGPYVRTNRVSNSVTHCGSYIDATPRVVSPVTPSSVTGPVCQIDVGGLAPGTHAIKITAITLDLAWGEKESPQSLPLALTPPSPPSAPDGLLLVPSPVAP